MKLKKAYMFLILGLFLLVACTNNDNEQTSNSGVEPDQPVQSDLFISFSELDTFYIKGNLSISGEVNTKEDIFYFTLTKHKKELIEETEVVLDEQDESEWREFTIETKLKEDEVDYKDDELPMLKLYVKDNGTIINPNFISIDLSPY